MGNITQHMATMFELRVVKLPARLRIVQGRLQHHAPIPYGTAPSPLSWRGVVNCQEVLIVDQLYNPLASRGPRTDKQSIKYGFDPFEPRNKNNSLCFGREKGITGFMLQLAWIIVRVCLFALACHLVWMFHTYIVRGVDERTLGLSDRILIAVTTCIIYGIGVWFARRESPLAHILLLESVALKDLRSFLAPHMEAKPVVTFRAGKAKGAPPTRGNRPAAGREEENSTFAKREWEYDSCETIPQSALESIVEQVTDHMAQNPYLRLYLKFELELVGDDVKGAFITELHQFFVDHRHREWHRMQVDWRAGAGTSLAKYVTVTHDGNLSSGLKVIRFVYRLALYLNLWWIFDVSAHFFWPQLYRPEYSKTVYFPKQPQLSEV